MNDLAGPVALALVGLWVAYLVPHKLRHRQQLLESRADDRFSEALRVVAVSDRPDRRDRSERLITRPAKQTAECTPSTSTRGLLTPGRGVSVRPAGTATGGTTVDRPLGTQDRLAAEAVRRRAQAHAARAAAVARRQAAARRRAALAVTLLGLTIVGWGVVGLSAAVTWVVAAVPTVLLGSVLVLGRRASRSWAEADAQWAARLADERRAELAPPRTGAVRATAPAGPAGTAGLAAPAVPAAPASPVVPVAKPAPQALVTGHAVRPSDTDTQVFAVVVADHGEAAAPARHATGATPAVRRPARPEADAAQAPADDAWSPVPVPRPTYTMKPTAPRREPAPLGEVEGSTAARPADESRTAPAALEAPVTTTGGIDLDAVLAKRRAAGE